MLDPCGYSPYPLPKNCKEIWDVLSWSCNEISRRITLRKESGKELDWSKDLLVILKEQSNPIQTYHRYEGPGQVKRAHFIKDFDAIKDILHLKRNGEKCAALFSEDIHKVLGSNNMLTCPFMEHSRLRGPFDRSFSERGLKKKLIEVEIVKSMLELLTTKEDVTSIRDLVIFVIAKNLMGASGNLKNMLAFMQSIVFATPQKLEMVWSDLKDYQPEKIIDLLKSDAPSMRKLSEEEKISAAKTLFIAGVHTTTRFLEFFMNEMFAGETASILNKEWDAFLENYNIQITNEEKVIGEYEDKFINTFVLFVSGGEIDGQSYPGSKWLEYCYLEALRLYPIVPDIKRIANEDISLETLQISKGDEIHLNILGYQKDPGIWGENPDEFRPERFERNPKLKSKLLAFSTGRQHCLGKDLVKMESKLLMGMVGILFQWKPMAKIEQERFWSVISDDSSFFIHPTRTITPRSLYFKDQWKTLGEHVTLRLYPSSTTPTQTTNKKIQSTLDETDVFFEDLSKTEITDLLNQILKSLV